MGLLFAFIRSLEASLKMFPSLHPFFTRTEQQGFCIFKQVMTSEKSILLIECAASGIGVGAVLMQRGRPLALESFKLAGKMEILMPTACLKVVSLFTPGKIPIKEEAEEHTACEEESTAYESRLYSSSLSRGRGSKWEYRTGPASLFSIEQAPTALLPACFLGRAYITSFITAPFPNEP